MRFRATERGLEGAVVVVVGGCGSIGSATATAFAAQGATVVVCDLAEALAATRGAAWEGQIPIDISDAASCAAAFQQVAASFGQVDVLINAAGVNRRGPLVDLGEAEWAQVLDINLAGVWRTSVAAYPFLAASNRAAVVHMGSTFGQRPQGDNGPYSVSKAGVEHLGRAMALEWATAAIRVNTVAPTLVESELTAEFRADPARIERMLSRIPLGRMATAEEVATAAVFLASPSAAMITGQCLYVDGGLTAG